MKPRTIRRNGYALGIGFLLLLANPLSARGQAASSILFVRGADRSGGFLEAGNDAQRTEQLADITNASTAGNNHGWFELATALRDAGYAVEQVTEAAENTTGPSVGRPVAFETMDLSVYDVVVFGSNNASYDGPAVDAVESYLRGGGAALFISDANFGGDWADASNSDQAFLDRLGLIAHQDQGTYRIDRDEFVTPDHPILNGVETFDGEGVTPVRVDEAKPGVLTTILARAEGQTRLNEPPFGERNQGPSRGSQPTDAALLAVTADAGRAVVHFDRNTFFNLNGAGTNLNRFDNRALALNLLAWLSDATIPGDYDGDHLVSQSDLNLVLLNWGRPSSPPPAGWTHHLPTDGVIGQNELDVVLTNWGDGENAPQLSAIPEPGAAAAALLGGGLFAGRRSR
ncbi:MAG: hypothetical protein AAF333_14395 [Planctomycetota bacterium]